MGYNMDECFADLMLSAAAAAKLLQSCPTLCDPIDGSPPGSPIPGILQARTLEWVAIFLLQCMKVKSESEGCSPWGRKESGTTERLTLTLAITPGRVKMAD